MSYALTTKAQVTLPKAIRDHLGVVPGDAVQFRIVADGTVRVEPAQAAATADAKRLASAKLRYGKLKGSGGHGAQAGTDALMRLLRAYDEDHADPGFSPPAETSVAPRRP